MALSGCSKPTSSDEVFVVGDSLTVAAPTLRQEMAERDIRLHGVDAANGRITREGLEALAREGSTLPEAVVVALGTNDVVMATEADVEQWVGRARAIVGDDRRLIWVNVHVEPDKDLSHPRLARFADFNRWLAEAAEQHDVEVANWHAWAVEHDVATTDDGVHYAPAESAERARFYARVVDGDIGTS